MNPCMRCGACCACYRVSFLVDLCGDDPGKRVPADLVVPVGKGRFAMRGTEGRHPRCAALKGSVGSLVSCLIYDRRPDPCRNFVGAWETGRTNPLCNRARTYFGLPPYEPF